MNDLTKISIVIPALNEESGIGAVLDEIPWDELAKRGYQAEAIVVDNGSTDRTAEIARERGATVVSEPKRGYGNAYKAGFSSATGGIIATGDADLTYPIKDIPDLADKLRAEGLDFITTDRMSGLDEKVMTPSHVYGNWILSMLTRILFGVPFKDSQSGMWVFKRSMWPALDVRSEGMPFSQELKIEAYAKGFKCAEVPITYRARSGTTKLSTFRDGFGNIAQLAWKRARLG